MAVYNTKQLAAYFDKIKDGLDDLSPFWNVVIPLIHNATMRRFAKGGPGWAPLAPSTIRGRIRERTWRVGVSSDQPILQREGDLRRSVMASGTGGSGDHFEIKRARSLTYGTSLKKAPFLQGDLDAWVPNAGRGSYSTKLPPRPFLYFSEFDQEVILTQAVGFLVPEI